MRDQLYECTEEKVLRYVIKDESRDVWRVFMQTNEFGRALETSKVVCGRNSWGGFQ